MDSIPPKRPCVEARTEEETQRHHDNHLGKEEEEEEEQEDIISSLPDSILCHILSKIPTKYAVGTAILSTRWKHLFSAIPNLSVDIDDTLLLHHPDQNLYNSNPVSHRSNNNSSFINFMYRFLTVTLLDVPRIRSFYLDSHHDYNNAHIEAWISAVLRLKVQHLTLFFKARNSGIVSLPCLFCCPTLEYLSLSQDCFLNVPSSVIRLPSLKKLSFNFVKFLHGDSFERILTGCPVLEELSLDGCLFQDTEALCITVPSLKLFVIRSCGSIEIEFPVVLDTPNLEFLHFGAFVARGGHPIKNLNSLLKAHMDIVPTQEQAVGEETYDNVAEFVTACSNVNSLYLSIVTMVAMRSSSRPMPTFPNLIELKLGALFFPTWQLLPHLLERSPNLQILVLTEGFLDYKGCDTGFQSYLPESVPICLLFHLQEIKIEQFKGKEDELKLVEYFLNTAAVLRKMKISLARLYPADQEEFIWQKLSMLPRRSKNCQIEALPTN